MAIFEAVKASSKTVAVSDLHGLISDYTSLAMKNVVVYSPSPLRFPLPFCDARYSHAQWLTDGLELGSFDSGRSAMIIFVALICN